MQSVVVLTEVMKWLDDWLFEVWMVVLMWWGDWADLRRVEKVSRRHRARYHYEPESVRNHPNADHSLKTDWSKSQCGDFWLDRGSGHGLM